MSVHLIWYLLPTIQNKWITKGVTWESKLGSMAFFPPPDCPQHFLCLFWALCSFVLFPVNVKQMLGTHEGPYLSATGWRRWLGGCSESFVAEKIPGDHTSKSMEGSVQPFTFWRKTHCILVCVCVCVYLRLKNKGSHCSTWASVITYLGMKEGVCSAAFLNRI